MNRAALEHSVPRTTLKDRLSGRIIHGSNIGPKPYLTQDEEKELAKFLINCFKMGYGKTRGEVLKIVEAVVKKKGRKHEGPISQGWCCCFRHRWPQLSLCRGDSFSIAREKKQQQNKDKGKASKKVSGEHSVPSLSGNRRKLPGEFTGSVKTYPKRKRMDPESNQEANEDICCVCFGLYKDDIDESGCVLADREWIQCSSKDCGLWSHVCCLEETDGGYNCAICQNVFI